MTAIDGDGSADGQDGFGPHRVAEGLRIQGQNFAAVSQVTLDRGQGDEALTMIAQSDSEIAVALPADMGPTQPDQAYSITVVNPSGVAKADLVMLRGERGSQGVQGDKGDKGDKGESAGGLMFTEDTTIEVSSGDCEDLLAVIADLHGQVIVGSATVTINVSGGSYACDESLRFHHPDGTRIKMVGNSGGTPTTIAFNAVTGLAVEAHHALGGFDGFVLTGSGGDAVNGVAVGSGARASVGPDVTVRQFSGSCYRVYDGGVLLASGTAAEDCIGSGYVATAATLNASGTVASGNKHGYSASRGASINAGDAQAIDNERRGFYAHFGAHMYAARASAIDNGGSGFYAILHASIEANSSVAEGNRGEAQYRASRLAFIRAKNVTVDDSTITFLPAKNTLSGSGAHIHSDLKPVPVPVPEE